MFTFLNLVFPLFCQSPNLLDRFLCLFQLLRFRSMLPDKCIPDHKKIYTIINKINIFSSNPEKKQSEKVMWNNFTFHLKLNIV